MSQYIPCQSHYLTTPAQGVTVDGRQDGLPDERDVVPPVQEVLFIVALEVPVLHLLDVCSGSKCLTNTDCITL